MTEVLVFEKYFKLIDVLIEWHIKTFILILSFYK